MNTFSRAPHPSPSLLRTRLSTLFVAAVSRSIRARHTLSAPSSPQIASRFFCFPSFSPPCFSDSFYPATILSRFTFRPSTHRSHPSHGTRATRVPTYSPALYRVTADRSHILGRRISKLETCRENQPAGRTFVVSDAEEIGYLVKRA